MDEGGGGSSSETDALILEAAQTARVLTVAELQLVLDQVAVAGFDPGARERARGSLAGLRWRGQVLRGADMLPPADAHYLRHAAIGQEWPAGTTLEGYVTSIRAVILDERSGVLISRYQAAWQLTILRRSAELQGPLGFAWVLLDYRLATGHWVTAYQPSRGLLVLQDPRRTNLRWLRRPR